MNLHFWWSVEPFLREKMLHLGVNCCLYQNQNAFHLWAGEIFVLDFILCVCFLLYMLKGVRAFQFSSLVEVISTGKCRLYKASATPDSSLFAESFVYGYGILLKVMAGGEEKEG